MISLRTLLRNPLQFLIMILGIALGVGVMVSIDLANGSAGRAFDLSTGAVAGQATHVITAGPQGVDEAVYVSLRTDPRWRGQLKSSPVVMTYAASEQLGDIPFTVLGIDPLAEATLRSDLGGESDTAAKAFGSLLTVPGSILLSASTAQFYGVQPCSATVSESCRITLSVNGQLRHAYLTGLLEPLDEFARRAMDTLIVTDISTAQQFSDMNGRLTQIDLIVPDEFDLDTFSTVLPAGNQIVNSARRNGQIAEMTAAFRINLTALSLLALVVGVFLIYNATTFSVVQRRSVFGTLRSLGYTREQVFRMVLMEAVLVGLLGSGLGLGLGILLGRGAVAMVSQTINDLFFVTSVRGLDLEIPSLLRGGLTGLFASILAAVPPAWEAAAVSPRLALSRAVLEDKTQAAMKPLALTGLVVVILGGAVLAIPTRNLIVSFAGTSAVVIGCAAFTPWVTAALMRVLGPPLEALFGFLGRLAPRNVIRSQSRTGAAVAALMIAVSVTIGVQVMIASFRTTVTAWLEQTMRGDIYISAAGISSTRMDTPLDPAAVDRVRSHPSVQSALGIRVVSVESKKGALDLIAVSNERTMDPRLFLDVEGSPEHTKRMLDAGAILLSEPLASRLGITQSGGSLDLLTPDGWRSFPIAGIYADYASTRGGVRLSLDVYRQLWSDNTLNGLVVFLKPGEDADALTVALRTQLSEFAGTQVNPNGVLRKEALVVFDRTFAITAAMQLIATVVAFIGVLSSLLALQLEKSREFGMLRALGLSIPEMRKLTLLETGLLGASAGVLALPTGLILAWILVFIINQRSFGWTLQLHLDLAPFAQAFVLSVGAAMLAAVYPTWRLSQVRISEALRGE